MKTTIKRVSAWICILIFLAAWFLLSLHENKRITAFQIRYGFIRVGPSSSSYVGLNFDEQVDQSDVIFAGKVVSVSPTMWNQDSGEYWSDGFMYHTIQIEVSQYIVDRIELQEKTTIEVVLLEPSPLDGDNRDNGLSVDSVVMIFARNANIGWQGGITKPFIEIISDPASSIFVQDDNGNFNGVVIHNLGKGKFTKFATDKGQEINRLGKEKLKADLVNGGGDFISDEISTSLPDFIMQIQAADQNEPTP